MPWTPLDRAAVALTLIALAAVVALVLYLPESLERSTLRRRREPRDHFPQEARWHFVALAIAIGSVTIVASILAPFPPLYGAALLLTAPLWGRRVKWHWKTVFIEPVLHGMENAATIVYVLASFATLIGILRLGPG